MPKLELRLGAAMIQPDGFSRHPKLEFPLTDGKHKPFESWFAETQDDFGAKYELRFDLDKVAFDYTTWLKIAEKDRLFLEELITAVPSSLNRLKDKQVSVSRNWKIWIDFANELVQIFNKQLILIKGRLGINQGSLSNQSNQSNQINMANGIAKSITPTIPSIPQSTQFTPQVANTPARQIGAGANPFAAVPVPSFSSTSVPRSASNPAPNPIPNQQRANRVSTPSVLQSQGSAFQAQQYSENQEYQQNVPPVKTERVSPSMMIGQPTPLIQGATGAVAQTSYRELSSTMSVTVTRKASAAKAEKPAAVKKKTTTSTPAKKSTRAR
jgi:hypothetical protein